MYRINVMEGIILEFVQGVHCIREFCVHTIITCSKSVLCKIVFVSLHRILGIVERIWHEIGRIELLDTLWNSVILSSSCQVAAVNLFSTKLQQK